MIALLIAGAIALGPSPGRRADEGCGAGIVRPGRRARGRRATCASSEATPPLRCRSSSRCSGTDHPSTATSAASGRGDGDSGIADMTSPGEQAASALVAIGRPAYDPLTRALKGPVWIARKNAAWGLGALGNRDAAPLLSGSLHDGEPAVRKESAWALGALDADIAVPALIEALKDTEPAVREQAAWALGAIGDRRAVPALSALLKDADAKARHQAAWALGAIGDRGAVEPWWRRSADDVASVREQAAWALGAIGDHRASAPLAKSLKDTDARVRRQAAWALGAIGGSQSSSQVVGVPGRGVPRPSRQA